MIVLKKIRKAHENKSDAQHSDSFINQFSY